MLNGYSLATFLLLLQYVWKEAGSHCCLYDIKDINISTDSHRMVRHCILFLLYSLTNLIAGFRLLAAFYALALKMYFRILVLDHQTIEPFL